MNPSILGSSNGGRGSFPTRTYLNPQWAGMEISPIDLFDVNSRSGSMHDRRPPTSHRPALMPCNPSITPQSFVNDGAITKNITQDMKCIPQERNKEQHR